MQEVPAVSSCRYQQITCNGPGSTGLSLCADGCSGPVDLGRGTLGRQRKNTTTNATAHDQASEEVRMAKQEKAPVGVCPECKRDGQVLRTSKHHEGRHCDRCVAKFAYRAKAASGGAKKKADQARAKAPSAAPKPSATAKPSPAAVAPQRPSPGTSGVTLRFEVTLPAGSTSLELMDVLRALPSDAKLVG
jgi:ribosomal protein L37AE/L43A